MANIGRAKPTRIKRAQSSTVKKTGPKSTGPKKSNSATGKSSRTRGFGSPSGPDRVKLSSEARRPEFRGSSSRPGLLKGLSEAYGLDQNADPFKEARENARATIPATGATGIPELPNQQDDPTLKTVRDTVGGALKPLGDGIKAVGDLTQPARQLYSDAVTGTADAIGGAVSKTLDAAGDVITSPLGAVASASEFFGAKGLAKGIRSARHEIDGVFDGVGAGGRDLIKGLGQLAGKPLTTTGNVLKLGKSALQSDPFALGRAARGIESAITGRNSEEIGRDAKRHLGRFTQGVIDDFQKQREKDGLTSAIAKTGFEVVTSAFGIGNASKLGKLGSLGQKAAKLAGGAAKKVGKPLTKSSVKGPKTLSPAQLDEKFGVAKQPSLIKRHEVGPDGKVLSNPTRRFLDKDAVRELDPKQNYIWATDQKGRIVLGREPKVPNARNSRETYGHPTLLDGGQGRIAGELKFSDGGWKLDPVSGRYSQGRAPEVQERALQSALKEFRKNGLTVEAGVDRVIGGNLR